MANPALLYSDSSGDTDLVHRAIGGDRVAFEHLYRKYVKRIFSLALRMVGSPQEAEEVTQEVFLQAYRSLPNFQGRSQFYTWLYRIASNIALQFTKTQIRTRKHVTALDTFEPSDPVQNPHHEAERRAFYLALSQAIQTLPPNQRLVMILGPIQGHTYQQIAQMLSTNEEVIKGRLHRARENIRIILKAERPHPE